MLEGFYVFKAHALRTPIYRLADRETKSCASNKWDQNRRYGNLSVNVLEECRRYCEDLKMPLVMSEERPDVVLDKATVLRTKDEDGRFATKLFRPQTEESLRQDGYTRSLRAYCSDEPVRAYVYGTADAENVASLVRWQLEESRRAEYFISRAERLIVIGSHREGYTRSSAGLLWLVDELRHDAEEERCNCSEFTQMLERALLMLARNEFEWKVLPLYQLVIGSSFGELEATKLVRLSKRRIGIRQGGQILCFGTITLAGWSFTGATYQVPDGFELVDGLAQSFFAIENPRHYDGVRAPASAFCIGERKTARQEQYTWAVAEFVDGFYKRGNLAPLTIETWVKVTNFPPGGGVIFEQSLS